MKILQNPSPLTLSAGILLISLALGPEGYAQQPGGVVGSAQRTRPGSPPKTMTLTDYKTLTPTQLKARAENGDLFAQNELGLAYASGRRVVKQPDYDEAFKWFRMAAESGSSTIGATNQGFAPAQYNLGSLYFYGSGVPKDYQEAIKWYRKAAEQGYVPAQYTLGWIYGGGKGMDEKFKESIQNFKESIHWFTKAAEQGDPEAQLNLGLMYLHGENLDPDYVEAYKWINVSAAQGNTNAIQHRVKLSVSMTPEQIAEGQRRAVQFNEKQAAPIDPKNKTNAPPRPSAGK